MDMKLHCSLCEADDIFTIYKGSSLCYHCYGQTEKLEHFEEERNDAILEIKDMVKQILEKLNSQ